MKSKLAQAARYLRRRLTFDHKLHIKLSRELIAETYLRGDGIEIGALHKPLKLSASARVKYVDRLSVADLKKQYPELDSEKLVNVDILADGERLETIVDDTQDFVVANHFVEHCQNPIGAVLNMLRVLKPGGILYLALPDKRCCFDSDRPVTSLAHIMRDYAEGPEWSRRQHFEEWARLVNKAGEETEVKKQADELMRVNYSIHFHVWTPFEMLEFILALRKIADFDLELCFEHDGVEVIFVLRKSDPNRAESFARILDQVSTPEPWQIDNVTYDGEVFEINGWALAPSGRHDLLTFKLNDLEFEEIDFPLPRADIGEIFWYKAQSDRAAFVCRSKVNREQLFKDGYATVKCVNRKTGLPVREEFNLYYPDDTGPDLPDASRRRRVAGNDNAALFRLEGFGIFKKLDLALRKTTNKSLGDFADILDWGCGCGRVTRNFHLLPRVRLVGTDIDPDNLNWCREHFTFGKFVEAPLHPPMNFADESFDLIMGISVFTHLREPDQEKWLAELSRVSKPGAVLLMSTQGESSVCCARWTRKMWDEWQERGFFASNDNSGLGAYIGDDDYYVTTYLTEEFIRRNWSHTFEIIDFSPGYIGNHQDLVVMRKA